MLWAHNDSGSEALLYCLKIRGAPCGVWEVPGVEAHDWEDLAAAPGSGGVDSLYIGDIGDNGEVRSQIVVHRVPDPDVALGGGTVEPESFTLTYPDRAHDAESMIVHRDTGDVYIVTKSSGRSRVFAARAPLEPQMELELIAKIEVGGLLPGPTGASLSPDNRRIVFATYSGGFELLLPTGAKFDAIWEQAPEPVDLGTHVQNEAVTYTTSGKRIISTSEGKLPPIYSVDLNG